MHCPLVLGLLTAIGMTFVSLHVVNNLVDDRRVGMIEAGKCLAGESRWIKGADRTYVQVGSALLPVTKGKREIRWWCPDGPGVDKGFFWRLDE